MEQLQNYTAISNPMLLRVAFRQRQKKFDAPCAYHHRRRRRQWYISPMMAYCLVAGTFAAMVVSPHQTRNMVQYRDFVVVVSATQQTSSIPSKRLLANAKSSGWINLGDIPRGGSQASASPNISSINAQKVASSEHSVTASSASTVNVIRIRMLDGTIQKVYIPSDQWTTETVLDTIRQSVIGTSYPDSEQQQKAIQLYNVTLPNGSIFTCLHKQSR